MLFFLDTRANVSENVKTSRFYVLYTSKPIPNVICWRENRSTTTTLLQGPPSRGALPGAASRADRDLLLLHERDDLRQRLLELLAGHVPVPVHLRRAARVLWEVLSSG